jgi:hypothetical protein
MLRLVYHLSLLINGHSSYPSLYARKGLIEPRVKQGPDMMCVPAQQAAYMLKWEPCMENRNGGIIQTPCTDGNMIANPIYSRSSIQPVISVVRHGVASLSPSNR